MSYVFDSLDALPDFPVARVPRFVPPTGYYRIPHTPFLLTEEKCTIIPGLTVYNESLLINLTAKMLQDKKRVLFIGLEMRLDEIGSGLVSSLTGVKMRTLLNPNFNSDEIVQSVHGLMSNLRVLQPKHFTKSTNIGIDELIERVEQVRMNGFNFDVLVLDGNFRLTEPLNHAIFMERLSIWAKANKVPTLAAVSFCENLNNYSYKRLESHFNTPQELIITSDFGQSRAFQFPETNKVIYFSHEVAGYDSGGIVLHQDEFGTNKKEQNQLLNRIRSSDPDQTLLENLPLEIKADAEFIIIYGRGPARIVKNLFAAGSWQTSSLVKFAASIPAEAID